ncbi:hypothetical protein [Plebeiibacterium marinum]|uniref:3-oxoacyl-ACP synthase n=1 Tax=Plebeiibacterium marinum TaxID=2992111 RepID=A0AAE3ME55_9BACT|nr:hypothetical protein [Plebeiobacterium marinum]MCW3806143.1 hypothetical protein [Plebeiobacterium marinum]
MNETNIKKQLLNEVIKLLDGKISVLQEAIKSAKESRDADSKSSVGDKYETSRAMMHIEIDKNETQLRNILKQRNEVQKIKTNHLSDNVEFGSVVYTSNGNYFISVALGKIAIDNNAFYSISLVSPIGILLNTRRVGDDIMFQGKNITIKNII